MKKRLPLLLVLVLGLAALLISELRREDAEVSPRSLLNFLADTQRESTRLPMRLTRLPDSEEISIGNNMAQRYALPAQTYDDRATSDYLQRVGERLAVRARRRLPYRFHFLPDPEMVNAFALPGGHIFLGKGLFSLLDSEDELAAILGHEIAHVDRYHCAERVQVEARARHLPLGGLATLPITLFQAGYTKTQEFEADHEGVHWAVRAGYSPHAAVTVQKIFLKLRGDSEQSIARTPQEELSQLARQTLRDYFRSHPLPEERIARLESLIRANGWENQTRTTPLPR